MSLSWLRLFNVRNVSEQTLDFNQEINVFHGENGSGKTTLLEAIHVLGLGRSFRSNRLNHLITHEQNDACIEAKLSHQALMHEIPIKLKKSRVKRPQFLLENQAVSSVAEIAALLPVQLLNLHGYQLLAAAPEERRKFIDWTMFHVKHEFLGRWQEYHRLLKQRNAVLRDWSQHKELAYWTQALARAGETLSEMRRIVLQEWIAFAKPYCEEMPGVKALNIVYERGWNEALSLEEQLEKDSDRDRHLGYTHAGPHRADLVITLAGQPSQHVLSTGQQKAFVSTLQILQARWMAEQTGSRPIILIDDLPSELDIQSRSAVFGQLNTFNAQIFITSVEKQGVTGFWAEKQQKMFHVKHGTVQEVV